MSFYSPAKPTNRVTTRRAVTYSDTDGGAFVTKVVDSKKLGHGVLARRSKRNQSNAAAPGRLSDISASGKILLSPSPGKTHRPVARNGTKTPSSASNKQAKVSADDIDDICSNFSAKVKVADSLTENAGSNKHLSPMPKDSRYVDTVETKKAPHPFSPVKTRSTTRTRNGNA